MSRPEFLDPDENMKRLQRAASTSDPLVEIVKQNAAVVRRLDDKLREMRMALDAGCVRLGLMFEDGGGI